MIRSSSEISGASHDDPRAAIRATALGLLARREHSRRELRHKLCQRDWDEADVDTVLDALIAENLLNESRFAESFVHARIGRGQGPVRIRAELRDRGVDEGLSEAALADAGIDWRELAGEVRRKRFGHEAPRDARERARQMRFLQQRGFTAEQIRSALEGGPDSGW